MNDDSISLAIDILGLTAVIIGFGFTYLGLKRNAINSEAANYHNAIEFQKDTWQNFLLNDVEHGKELLVWHLNERGLEDKGPLENKKTLFILLRLDVYEEMLLSAEKGLLTEKQIIGWKNAIQRDFKSTRFMDVWDSVFKCYAPILDDVIREPHNKECESGRSK